MKDVQLAGKQYRSGIVGGQRPQMGSRRYNRRGHILEPAGQRRDLRDRRCEGRRRLVCRYRQAGEIPAPHRCVPLEPPQNRPLRNRRASRPRSELRIFISSVHSRAAAMPLGILNACFMRCDAVDITAVPAGPADHRRRRLGVDVPGIGLVWQRHRSVRPRRRE